MDLGKPITQVVEELKMLEIMDHGRVREIRLNHPPANAMNPGLISTLRDELERSARVADAIVISGRPGMFSAGLDIPALLQLDRGGMTRFWHSFLALLRTIAYMPVPTAFALTGHAPAGGIVIALFADYRIMCGGNYKTGLNEVQVGLVVSPVIKNALVRLIGPHPAERILVPGSILSPDQALEIGLVDELEENPEKTTARAIAWCEHLISLPRNAMSLTRQLVREDLHSFFVEASQFKEESFVELWFSDLTQTTLRGLVARLQKK
jgi:enoyl-CoA hydratase/carnithine racemase